MKNIYAFHGCDSKSGVTMLAQSAARRIAEMAPGADVLVLSLCDRQNAQFVRENISDIDYYKDKIKSGVFINKESLRDNRIGENLYLVSGLTAESEKRLYFPEEALQFAEDMSTQFEIVILDTGSELDSGLAIGGLLAAEKRYMVIPQNEAALARYCKTKLLYERINFGFDCYVINRFREKDVLSLDYIKKRCDFGDKKVYVVHDAGDGRRAEYERKTFVELRNGVFEKDINAIAEDILLSAGISPAGSTRKKRWKGFI